MRSLELLVLDYYLIIDIRLWRRLFDLFTFSNFDWILAYIICYFVYFKVIECIKSLLFENQIRIDTRLSAEYNEKKMRGTNDSREDSLPSRSSTHDKEFCTYLLCVETVMGLDSFRQRLSRNFSFFEIELFFYYYTY